MSDLTNIARPYAQAVFELARDRDDFAGWGDQLALLANIAADRNMVELLKNPAFSNDQQISLVLDICGDKLSADGVNLIKLLVNNDRVNALPDIAVVYAEKRAEAESVIEADMITATPIDDSQRQAFSTALQSKLGRSIKLNFEVDEDLIGGAVIRAGDWVIDGSVKAQLEQLVGAVAA
ncbi:MAG: F0F1 ATP synthase subunit delta [Arenicellales bacterium]